MRNEAKIATGRAKSASDGPSMRYARKPIPAMLMRGANDLMNNCRNLCPSLNLIKLATMIGLHSSTVIVPRSCTGRTRPVLLTPGVNSHSSESPSMSTLPFEDRISSKFSVAHKSPSQRLIWHALHYSNSCLIAPVFACLMHRIITADPSRDVSPLYLLTRGSYPPVIQSMIPTGLLDSIVSRMGPRGDSPSGAQNETCPA